MSIKKTTIEFKVEKAREWETFKNLPKFSHPALSVIHPPSVVKRPEPGHMPAKSLQFDGAPVSLTPKPHHDKYEHIAVHLVRPPVDQEKLMKIREKEKLRK